MSSADENYEIPENFDTGWKASPEVIASAKNRPDSMILPLEGLRKLGPSASVDVPKDSYGVVRKIPMYLVINDQVLPALALKTLMIYWKLTPEQVSIIPGDAIHLKSDVVDERIPIDEHGNYLVNFRYDLVRDKKSPVYDEANNGEKTFLNSSFSKLVRNYFARFQEGNNSVSLFDVRDKIIFIGVTATGGTDLGPSPFQSESPRPLIHLNVMDNILKRDYLHKIPDTYVWIGFLVLAYLSLYLLHGRSFWLSALLPLVLIVLYVVGAFYIFSAFNQQIALLGPTLAFFLLHVGSVGKQVLEERAARDQLRRTFSTYVSKGILDEISRNPDACNSAVVTRK
ncbi:MAG: CHASE2 domain-containing protein [Blastochloris sp.]|nr:CHASE2 domain-containing protein [Blastochloris sp.]